jgi:adenine-specific DNA-methyltransferase
MPTPKEKLQDLLRELFQFDCADLDFGIYRIMNYKRDAIEKFIQKDLIETVEKELDMGVAAGQTKLAEQLDKKVEEIRRTFNETAIDSKGILDSKYHELKLGNDYLLLQSLAGSGYF